MKLRILRDAVFLKFAGFALLKCGGSKYHWRPRYDESGKIFMWLRDENPSA